MRIRRPEWWPPALWPGAGARRRSSGGLPERPARPPDAPRPPGESFLEAVVAAFGADGAAVYRLDRERSAWELEARVGEPASPSADPLPAGGHPLTWCLREAVLMQVEADELLGRRAGGWALAGAAPSADRALVVRFAGSPPSGAREALRPAVEHLASLHAAGLV